MKSNALTYSLLVSALCVSGLAYAETASDPAAENHLLPREHEHRIGEFTANVALTSDYVWRGISQTNENPAIQGGFDFSHASGLYLGTWASNVTGYGNASSEHDIYAGYTRELGDFRFDVGYLHYLYPDNGAGLDFGEAYVGGGYKAASAKVWYDVDNENLYAEIGADVPMPEEVTLLLHVGSYDFDAGTDYIDYRIGVSREFGGFGFELSYSDTDLDNNPLADGRLIFTLSKDI